MLNLEMSIYIKSQHFILYETGIIVFSQTVESKSIMKYKT